MKYFVVIMMCMMFGLLQLQAQDTITLNENTFYKISTTATNKTIVFAKRNVQLKQKGNYVVKIKEGNIKFSLNNNFHIEGVMTTITKDGKQKFHAQYVDGIPIYTEETFDQQKITKSTKIAMVNKAYIITKIKIRAFPNQLDSTIEIYKNQQAILKEKYTNGKLIFKNDELKKLLVVYDSNGSLIEKHASDTVEKYNSDGTVYYKKIHSKGKILEYKDNILYKMITYNPDEITVDQVEETIYDTEGKVVSTSKEPSILEVAPEYYIFGLDKREFESLVSIYKKIP